MRKFIEFLEVAALMILVAVLTVGVINYTKTIDSEDPIVETPVEDEVETSFTLLDEYGNVIGTYNYEDGMTWDEYINSDLNEGFEIEGNCIILDGSLVVNSLEAVNDDSDYVYSSDLIKNTSYYLV